MDPLTSTLNRRAFSAVLADRAATDAASARRGRRGRPRRSQAAERPARTCAGDAALQAVAEALRGCLQAEDLLFRWGGDEFTALLKSETAAAAEDRLGRLNEALRQSSLQEVASPVDLRASVGLAEFDGPASLDAAIAQADRAMYNRKKSA
jgi:GGDEF domain-containing protein